MLIFNFVHTMINAENNYLDNRIFKEFVILDAVVLYIFYMVPKSHFPLDGIFCAELTTVIQRT